MVGRLEVGAIAGKFALGDRELSKEFLKGGRFVEKTLDDLREGYKWRV